jgi:hypothetical protein
VRVNYVRTPFTPFSLINLNHQLHQHVTHRIPRKRKMDHEEEMPMAMMIDETPSPVPMESVVPTVEAQSDSEVPEGTEWNIGPDPGVQWN